MKELMVVVERAVRPVRAGARRKDRMREELLAHLTSIYEEELARLGDERAAREEAIRRFGESAALTRGLQESLTRRDRLTYFVERWNGWRAQESAARHAFRLAVTLLVLLVAFTLAMVATWLTERLVKQRGVQQLPLMLLSFAALLGIGTGAVFLLGLLYFKMRDALCGGPGVSRSLLKASAYGALFSLVVLALVLGMLLVPCATVRAIAGPGSVDLGLCLEILWPWWYVLALVSPLLPGLYGRMHGPTEIRHAEWAGLDLEA
jgi:hypothetical protein